MSRASAHRIPPLAVALVILAAAWISRYRGLASFGLYEDDPARVIPGIEATLGAIWSSFEWNWLHVGAQGRPFHPFFIFLFSWLGGKLGSLQSLYVLAFFVFALNGFLLYRLLLAVSGLPVLALTAAVGYALFPADTTQAYLTIAFGGQTSVTFFLLASLAYVSRRRILAYALIFCSLTTYETVFPVFLAVPLLCLAWDRRLVRTLAGHAAVMGAMLGVVALARKAVGEGQISTLDVHKAMTYPWRQMAVGPFTALTTSARRPFEALLGGLARDTATIVATVAISFLLATWISRQSRTDAVAGKGEPAAPAARSGPILWRLAVAGLAMMVLAYPLAFTEAASTVDGRGTRVHLPAAVGAAMLWGCAWTAILTMASGAVWRRAGRVALAVTVGGLVAFGLDVQRDYRDAWTYQRTIWADLVRLCPDAGNDTVVLLDQSGLPNAKQISAWGWYLPYGLRQMFRFPPEWASPPLVYGLLGNWRELIEEGKAPLDVVDLKGWKLEPLEHPRFILIETRSGAAVRRDGSLVIGSRTVKLGGRGQPVLPELPHGTLYRLMFPTGTGSRG